MNSNRKKTGRRVSIVFNFCVETNSRWKIFSKPNFFSQNPAFFIKTQRFSQNTAFFFKTRRFFSKPGFFSQNPAFFLKIPFFLKTPRFFLARSSGSLWRHRVNSRPATKGIVKLHTRHSCRDLELTWSAGNHNNAWTDGRSHGAFPYLASVVFPRIGRHRLSSLRGGKSICRPRPIIGRTWIRPVPGVRTMALISKSVIPLSWRNNDNTLWPCVKWPPRGQYYRTGSSPKTRLCREDKIT